MTRRREEDLAGQRFGRLVAQARSDRSRGRRTYWVCVCDCGRTIEARADGLKCGDNITCGCGQPQRMRDCHTKHGLSNTGTYAAWESMWRRCSDPRDKGYRLYGGRGIKVCDRWRDVAAFLADMGERPPGTTLDRIDVDGHYEPGNCRWATKLCQARNTRSNVATWEKACAIRAEYAAGVRPKQLAAKYGMSDSNVHMIVAGKTWKAPA